MPSLPEDSAPSYFIRSDGAQLAYHRRIGTAPGILFLGGFHSDMTGTKATHLEGVAGQMGQAFLRFDYRGHGQSEGAFADHVLGDWIDDAVQVFDHLTEGPQIVVGSSMGGWIAAHLALRFPERFAGLITLAAAPDFISDMMENTLPAAVKAEILETGQWIRPSAYDDAGYPITRALLEDGVRQTVLDKKIPLSCPVRLLHGTQDADVPWERSRLLMEQIAADDVTLTLIKDGDHRLSDEQELGLLSDAVAGMIG